MLHPLLVEWESNKAVPVCLAVAHRGGGPFWGWGDYLWKHTLPAAQRVSWERGRHPACTDDPRAPILVHRTWGEQICPRQSRALFQVLQEADVEAQQGEGGTEQAGSGASG